jgi:exo-beta-1,3-glucanase (GH17 family)
LALNLVSNSSKVNKSKDKSSKSKGPQKKTSEKNKDLKQKSVESVKYSPQIDDGTYRATEYYKHNNWSFYDYMTVMKEYRLPVPSNKS